MEGEANRIGPRLGIGRPPKPVKAGTGALVFPYDPDLARALVWYHRTSSRILFDLYETQTNTLDELYDELKAEIAKETRPWLKSSSFSIRARNLQGFSAGAGQIVGAVKNALIDGAKEAGATLRLEVDNPDLHFALRLHDDSLTLSLDLSGGGRHLRHYRLDSGEAPMRENLASVLVMLTRWNAKTEALVDPMAGSATIAIEGALMARGAPLWRDSGSLAVNVVPELSEVATEELFADTTPAIWTSELHARRASGARQNVEAAGASDRVEVKQGDFRQLDPAHIIAGLRGRGWSGTTGVILCNPPYGQRLEVPIELYRELGEWCREFAGWRVGVLVANHEFEQAFGIRARVKKPLRNGNQPSQFMLFDI